MGIFSRERARWWRSKVLFMISFDLKHLKHPSSWWCGIVTLKCCDKKLSKARHHHLGIPPLLKGSFSNLNVLKKVIINPPYSAALEIKVRNTGKIYLDGVGKKALFNQHMEMSGFPRNTLNLIWRVSTTWILTFGADFMPKGLKLMRSVFNWVATDLFSRSCWMVR